MTSSAPFKALLRGERFDRAGVDRPAASAGVAAQSLASPSSATRNRPAAR